MFIIFCCHSFVFHIILALLRQVGDLETDRSYYYNCIRPGCPSAVQFFFWLAMYLGMLPTKFHRLLTKTVCLRTDIKSPTGALQVSTD